MPSSLTMITRSAMGRSLGAPASAAVNMSAGTGVYVAASNGSARRPALVATNGRSPRAARALRIRSSERPSP